MQFYRVEYRNRILATGYTEADIRYLKYMLHDIPLMYIPDDIIVEEGSYRNILIKIDIEDYISVCTAV